MSRIKSISFVGLLAAPFALALAVCPMLAAAEPPPADAPAAVPEDAPRTTINAAFQRYVLAPNGRPMGLLVDGGAFVRVPHHAMRKDAPQLNAGDALEIEGVQVQTPTGTLVARAVVKQNGAVIADASQPRERGNHEEHAKRHHKHHVELQDVSGAGKVASVITGPRGRVIALVLDDGTTATGRDLGALGLKAGDAITFSGRGGVYAQGRALRVEKITMPDGSTRELPRRAPRPAGEKEVPS